MAKAYKCDRCNELYETPAVKIPGIQITDVSTLPTKMLDLCTKCYNDLLKFLGREEKDATL